MSAFPESIPPAIPYSWTPRFLTKIGGPYETPVLDARIVWPYPQMVTNLSWPKRVTPNSDYVALYDFFVAMRGRATAFTFFDFNGWKSSPIGMQWHHVLVGVRNGTTTVYGLPGKNMTSILVYDSAAPATPLTPTTTYAIVDVIQGTKSFFVAGNHAALFSGAATITVTEANAGTYTVISSTFLGVNTQIVVAETIPDATINGAIFVGAAADYIVAPGAGTDGRDKITLTTGGTAGHVVDVSFVGRLGMSAHFTVDEMPFDTFYTSVQARGLAIEQVYS